MKIPQTVINIKMTINSRNKLGKATKKNNEKILRLIDIENRKKKTVQKLYKSEKEIIDKVYKKKTKEIKIEIGKI